MFCNIFMLFYKCFVIFRLKNTIEYYVLSLFNVFTENFCGSIFAIFLDTVIFRKPAIQVPSTYHKKPAKS